MVKGRGAGLGGTVKGAGTGRGHGSKDIDTSYSYPLVDPRLVEAHDDGTLVQSTGADRSLVQPLDMMVNPPYSQHLKGDRIEGDRIKNDDRIRKDDRNKKGDRSKSYRIKDVRDIEKEDEEYKDEDKGAGRGDIYKGGGAGLDDMVKDKGAGRSREVRRIKGRGKRATR